MKKEFVVYVDCKTYNQSAYIIETLNGFCKQQTTFPFVCGIIDDASTDGEPDIIINYLQENFLLNDTKICRQEETADYNLIFVQHKSNTNCYFAVVLLKYNHFQIKKKKQPYIEEWYEKSKYIAFCEGDDHWVDQLKLQIQVDALEKHPELDICSCEAAKINKEGKDVGHIAPYNSDTIIPIEEVLIGGGSFVATNTLVYRNGMDMITYSHYELDYFLQVDGSLRGGMYYIAKCMTVYHIETPNSWTLRMRKKIKDRYSHLENVYSMLCVLDYKTDKKYSAVLLPIKNRLVFNMYHLGLIGGCFKNDLQKLPILNRFKMALTHFYKILFY